MLTLAVRRRALSGVVLVTGLWAMGPGTARAEAAPEAEMATLARSADAAKAKVLAAKDRVLHVEQANVPAVDDRRAKEKALKERKRAASKHLKDAAAAFKKFQQAEKRGKVTEKDEAELAAAKAAYEAALAEGKAIKADLAALHKLEDEIGGRVDVAAADVDAASASAEEARTAGKTAAPIARTLSSDATKDVGLTKKDADKTKSLASLGGPADYPKKKAANEEKDAKVAAAIDDAKKVLASLPKAPAQPVAK